MQQEKTATEQVQEIAGQLSQLKANRSDALTQVEQIEQGIASLTGTLNGVNLGMKLAAERAQAEDQVPAPDAE